MNTIKLDLSHLHGFRLLAGSMGDQERSETPISLASVLGARLGSKIGDNGKVTAKDA